ncbi:MULTISPECIES: hypothetical protein [Erwiniaceae]|uniref:hypothetical protein n=1 Tax=Erwiniaceae TaxID=1903409 RepID=UPI00190C509C|nr:MULTISPECIES: hypothetical protein [Erwiniaceae]MBK0091042.1 hypothetical protein [Erwinia sp. S59]MBK0122620.1 hypothetical protein [Pantoea sp. S61]MBK0122671.1 hypothetical protein [Pantoea sp. S61]
MPAAIRSTLPDGCSGKAAAGKNGLFTHQSQFGIKKVTLPYTAVKSNATPLAHPE